MWADPFDPTQTKTWLKDGAIVQELVPFWPDRTIDADGDGIDEVIAGGAYLKQDGNGGFTELARWTVPLTMFVLVVRKPAILPILVGTTNEDSLVRSAIAVAGANTTTFSSTLDAPGAQSRKVIAWDHDGNGESDLLIFRATGGTLVKMDDKGQLSKGMDIPELPQEVYAAMQADLDEDGTPEVLLGSLGNAPLNPNEPSPKYRTQWFRATATGIEYSGWAVPGVPMGVADFDADGHLDVVVREYQYEGNDSLVKALHIYRGDGTGHLSLAHTIDVTDPAQGGAGTPWGGQLICDYDGDGMPDIGSHTGGYYGIILNTSK